MGQVIVIGGGPSGIMAAGQCAKLKNHKVILLESNTRLGKKLAITGKGRCNFTNACSLEEFIDNMPGNGHFLFSALNVFNNDELRNFFYLLGVPSKIERGGRVFPESDKAGDILNALHKFVKDNNVEIFYNAKVKQILVDNGKVSGVVTKEGKVFNADKVIVATGGASYPVTGSRGEGFKLAEKLGHKIVSLKPGLVPIEIKEDWIKELQGLSLKNVEITALINKKKSETLFGEMIFTHYGISGPIVLTLSRHLLPYIDSNKSISLNINLKPALSENKLDNRIQRDFMEKNKKEFKNCLDDLLPSKIIPVIVSLSNIPPEKTPSQISKEERLSLVRLLQNLKLNFKALRPLGEAIVTVGGVSVKEVNPKTMESKLIQDLYFCGEVLDIDGYTGGFNLQSAFSTGYVAGTSASS